MVHEGNGNVKYEYAPNPEKVGQSLRVGVAAWDNLYCKYLCFIPVADFLFLDL